MTQRVTRRLILVASGASLVAMACGDDSETSGQGGASSSSSNSSGQGGSSAGGSNAGGSSAGGSNAGGDNTGGGANACGMALMVSGSNYDIDPHDIMIPLADLEEGTTKTYTSTGRDHTHTITLTEADFTALRNGETVTIYTCLDQANFTDHEWAISCADPNIMPVLQGEIGTSNDCPAGG